MGFTFLLNTMPHAPKLDLHQKRVTHPLAHMALYPDKFEGIWSMLLKENLLVEEKTPSTLLNAQDIAVALSIGLSTVYLLLERGELPSIRIGRSIRIRPEDLEEFIESKVQRKAAYE